jgi:hypothetical protein
MSYPLAVDNVYTDGCILGGMEVGKNRKNSDFDVGKFPTNTKTDVSFPHYQIGGKPAPIYVRVNLQGVQIHTLNFNIGSPKKNFRTFFIAKHQMSKGIFSALQ